MLGICEKVSLDVNSGIRLKEMDRRMRKKILMRIFTRQITLSSLMRRVKFLFSFLTHLGPFVAYYLKWKEAVFLPSSFDIEPNNNCNFRCPHCQLTYWNKKTTFLNFKSFNMILDQVPSLTSVKLQGMGEPLLNKELVRMLKSGESRGIVMAFSSNASLCDQQMAEQLVQLRNTTINFSVDGATAETFEKIRVGGDFEEVVKNIKRLIKLRTDKKKPKISIWSLIVKDNIQEIPEIVKLGEELGVDLISFQLFLNDWGKEKMRRYTRTVATSLNSKELVVKLAEAKKIAKKKRLNIEVYYENFLSKKRKCRWPWIGAYIASNGDVVPCCVLADSDTVKMGNVFEDDFLKIWYSKKYRDFRKRIITHDLPDYCKNCYVDA